MKKLCLIYSNSSHRGPGMVVTNLKLGLQDLEIEVVDRPNKADHIGCLQHPQNLSNILPLNTILGPNIFVTPQEDPDMCAKFNNFIVPSNWVRDLYYQFNEMKDKNIQVWPVGIDTERWQPCTDIHKDLDCFIYYKNRTAQDLQWVVKLLKTKNLKFELLEYGNYKELELHSFCLRSKFAILLTGTESQGIAYMNILSSGLPCYVFNKSSWTCEKTDITVPASSVPYFSKDCGEIVNDIDVKHFRNFLIRVKSGEFNPRKYILKNHTLKAAAKNYISLFEPI